jgi:hypothetical protein
MKLLRVIRGLAALFCLLSPLVSEAEDERQEEQKDQKVEVPSEQRPVEQREVVYTPPSPSVISKPGGRVGGSSRGSEAGDLTLFVLAPEDHTGLTTQEQPVLYWYMSRPTSFLIMFTLITDQSVKPLVEEPLTIPLRSGLQRVRLADYGVHLSPGVHYQWSITFLVDSEHSSKNLLAGGAIEYLEPSPAFRTRLIQAAKRDIPHLYAAEGLWYDTVSALADLLESSPHDVWLRRQRSSLLQQVALPEVE